MTIEEKREAIEKHCFSSVVNCGDCPVRPILENNENCFSEPRVEGIKPPDIERNYALLFSGEGKEPDMVNHPPHYETGKYDCIEVMVEAIGTEAVRSFCLCNAFKYIYRCTKKHETPDEDVAKAVWYLNKFLALNE